MGKIYESLTDYEEAMEKEFRLRVEEIGYYQGNRQRYTLDGEWTEEDLKDDVWDEANKILHGDKDKEGWLSKHKDRALYNKEFKHTEYIVEDICNRYDLIEVYNRAVDKHRNDEKKLFGICYFDELVRAEVNKMLKQNLVTK